LLQPGRESSGGSSQERKPARSIQLALLGYGFYVSLGGQPMFGSTLKDD
jgi:hypothetical protein